MSTAPRVLVTGCGGAAAIAFIRSLRAEDVTIFAADMDPCAAGLYLVPAERRLLLPSASDPSYADEVLRICRRFELDVLVPTVDAELPTVALIRAGLESTGTRVMMTSASSLATCLDKWRLVNRCKNVCPVPASIAVEHGWLARRTFGFPFIAKPRTGAGGRGVRMVHTEREAEALPLDAGLIAQEYLPGEEYSVDVLSAPDGSVLSAVVRSRLKVDSGVSVAGRIVRDEQLERQATDVARTVGLQFVSNIQFRRDSAGTPRLLEVNPRFPGTMSLTVAAGVNMPSLALDLVLGRHAEATEPKEVMIVRMWSDVLVPAHSFDAMLAEGMAGKADMDDKAGREAGS